MRPVSLSTLMPVVLRMAPAMPVMPCSRSTGLLTTVTDCGVCRIDSSMPVVACRPKP